MRKGMLALAFAAFIAVTGAEAWNHYFGVSHPQALLITENALVTDGLIALGSASIEQAVRLERTFIGVAHSEEAGALLDGTPFARFQAAGIDPRRDLSHLVFAAYAGVGQEPGFALALLGRFRPGDVLVGLKRDSVLEPIGQPAGALWSVRRQSPDTCQWSRPWQLYVGDGLLLAADPERMPQLLRRLEARASAGRDLARWRAFRSDQLGSLALFVPEQAPNAGPPFIQKPLSEAHAALEAFDEVYLGLGVWPLPARARLALMLAGNDALAARATAGRWQRALAGSRADWALDMPTVARLHDALSVEEDGAALRVSASLDKAWLQDAAKIPQEFMSLVFKDSGFSVDPDEATAAAERIDDNPAQFLPRLSADSLADYRAEPPFVPEADAISGPFGIQLSAVELVDDADVGLAVTVGAVHRGIANLGEARDRVQLYIDSVTDASGRELLREETCGPERNALPANLDGSGFNDSVRGEKTVRLKPGVGYADIHRIRGRVTLSLPVETETVKLAALENPQRIERDGVRVELQRSASDTLNTKVYGDVRRLLAVRGLNGGAQPLAGTSSMSSGFLFGEGRAKTQRFAGQVAAAELVLARRDVQRTYGFALNGARVRNTQNTSVHPPADVPVYSLADLQRRFSTAPAAPEAASLGEVRSGPFRIRLDQLRSFIGLQAGFSVYAPAVPGLADNLSALTLEIDALENAAGENLVADDRQRHALDLNEDWQDKTRLQGQARLRFKSRAETGEVKRIRGHLQLRLPKVVRSHVFATLEVGRESGEGDTRMVIKRVDERGVTVDFGAKAPPLVAVNAYNAGGESLWIPHPRLEYRDSRWLGRFETHGDAARLELLLAAEQVRQAYPFVFEL